MSIGILLYLDLEFWEGTLKTLTPSLQEIAKYFTTRSYLTLTKHFDFNDLMAFGMFILAALLTFIYLICRWLNIEKPPQNLTGLRVDFLNL